jgi:hypothetical protein
MFKNPKVDNFRNFKFLTKRESTLNYKVNSSFLTSFAKTKYTTRFTTFQNGGVGNLKIFKFLLKQKSTIKSTPPHLSNGEGLGKCFYIFGITTLQNGGVGHLKTLKFQK